MRIINGLYEEEFEDCPHVVAVGAFDGVHRGHRMLLEHLCRTARENGARSAVFTFEPVPAEVFRRHATTSGMRLTLREERNELLQEQCADLAIIADFDEALRNMSARDFARDILVGKLNTKILVASQRHTFGRHAEADVNRIAQLGKEFGFEVIVLDPFTIGGGDLVTSTRVRKLLWAGEVAQAAELLGRPHSLCGEVITGRGVGRDIGFATANLSLPPAKLIPADGIYAALVDGEGFSNLPAAVNIGPAPTFGVETRLIEAHIIADTDFDLPGSQLCIKLIEHLRDILKFHSPEALSAQIAHDVERTVAICAAHREATAAACKMDCAPALGEKAAPRQVG